jgi:hypothetical protein
MDDIVGRRYNRAFLETLSETEVRLSERALIRHINALRSKSKDTYEFEVELCYVQDEINRRGAATEIAGSISGNGGRTEAGIED